MDTFHRALILLFFTLTPAYGAFPYEDRYICVEAVYEEDFSLALDMAIQKGIEVLQGLGFEKIEITGYAINFKDKKVSVLMVGISRIEAKGGEEIGKG